MIFLDTSAIYALVGRMSFLVMKRRGVRVALAFDADFEDEGFQILGSGR
jgi:predicted nucleic acid-binding protein